MKLSAKSRDELYRIVHEEIIAARIEAYRLTGNSPATQKQVDDLMYLLTVSCPQKAIDLFK